MRITGVIVGLGASLSGASSPALAQERATADSAAVVSTVAAFHAALAEGDSAAVLRLVAPDLRVLESGHIEDLSEYRAHHLAADMAFAQAVTSERHVRAVSVVDSIAWVSATSRTTGTYRGRPIDADGAELMVLTRGTDGWRIRAIHWSSRTHRPE